MLQKLENKGVAVLITACLVVISVLVGARISLTKLQMQAMDNGYYEFWSDVYAITGDTGNLLTVAGYYLNEDHPRMEAVEDAIEAVEDAHTLQQIYVAADQLREAVDALDDYMATMAMDGQDAYYHQKLMGDIDSNYLRLERSVRTTEAEEFNRQLRKFPANVLCRIVGIDPLELPEYRS